MNFLAFCFLFILPYFIYRLFLKLYILQRCSSCRKIHYQKLLIVLGSGGHTTEMFFMLDKLPKHYYTTRIYIMAYNDNLSLIKAKDYEKDSKNYKIIRLPRPRQVGQSYLSSIPYFVYACIYSFFIIFRHGFLSILITNGPGTSLPLSLMGLYFSWFWGYPIQFLFIESFARVHNLSLTGKLLYPLISNFIVQWPQLKSKYSRTQYCGLLI
jgi:beta-1,4-N-acetylglucosaminyltransferase